jgi:hypothetical protein
VENCAGFSIAHLHEQQQLGVRHQDSGEEAGNVSGMVGGGDDNRIPPSNQPMKLGSIHHKESLGSKQFSKLVKRSL